METFYSFASFIVNCFLVFFSTFFYFRHHRGKAARIIWWVGVIALSSTLSCILSFFWAFSLLDVSYQDLFSIIAFTLVLESVALFFIMYSLFGDRILLFLLGCYFLANFLLLFSYPFFLLLLSYSFIFSLFLFGMLSSKIPSSLSSSGLLYGFIGILWVLFVLFDFSLVRYYFVVRIFLLLFIYLLVRDIDHCSFRESLRFKKRIFAYLRHIVLVIALANLLFLSVVGVHEAGHVISAKIFGCENIRSVLYEDRNFVGEDMTYTEILCVNNAHKTLIVFSGVVLPILISLVLLFVGSSFVHKLSLLMAGFSLLVSYGDFVGIGLSESIVMTSLVSGLIMLVLALFLLGHHGEGDIL